MASPAQDLQSAIYGVLTGSPDLMALVGGRVFDGVPPEGAGFPRITFGSTDAVPMQLECLDVREETLQIDIWTRENGELFGAKLITDMIFGLLDGADLALATHAVSSCVVEQARVFRDRDGLTAHGVVQVSAMLERK